MPNTTLILNIQNNFNDANSKQKHAQIDLSPRVKNRDQVQVHRNYVRARD